MKLLFVIKSLSLPGGGAERVLAEIASGLSERGHDVHVLSFDQPGSRDFYPFAANVRRLRLPVGRSEAPSGVTQTLRRIRSLWREAKRLAPDVAIGFMHSAFIPLGLGLAGSGVPMIASEHIVFSHYDRRPLQRALLRIIPSLAFAITAISEEMRKGFPRPIRRKMVIVPNPVSAAPSARADVAGEGRKTLLTVGRLEQQKDQQTLIAAFALLAERFSEWDLRIVGEGVLRPSLEAQVEALGLGQRIALPGATAAIGREYLAAQMFVMASTYESFGLATAEALAHGLPAVGFADCPGTNGLIVDGENGLLVAGVNRPAALAEGLAKLMASPELRRRLGEKGPGSVAAFALPALLDRWQALLTSAERRSAGASSA